MSASMISSSAFLGWRGKLEAWGLQALRAQVMKFRVRSFILVGGRWCESWVCWVRSFFWWFVLVAIWVFEGGYRA